MKIRRTNGEIIFGVVNTIFMVVMAFVTLYPLWHVLMASISIPTRIMAHRGLLFAPLGLSDEAYVQVFKHPLLVRSYLNTVFYVVVGTAVNMIMTFHGAYVLSRRNVYFKKHIMIMITITMFVSGGLVPNYLLVSDLGMLNTPWAILLPGAIGTYNMVMMRTYFQGIPYELEESARIDGATDIRILYQIILPVSTPIIAVIALYYGVGHWNSWFNAMIYLTDRNLFPIQLVLREILIQGSMDALEDTAINSSWKAVEETLKYATIIVATVPILCVYPFLQKYFDKGVLVGALKG
jgi:putative aldouronate transport system permease protein